MALIKMTPQDLRDSATFLESKNTAIATEVTALQKKINEVTADWEGASKGKFVTSFEQILPVMNKQLPEIIAGIEKQLNGAADTIEKADADIASAFSQG